MPIDMCRFINQVFYLPDESLYTADTNKLIILVILNWNTETLANILSHIFPRVVCTGHETLATLISGRDLEMSTLMPTVNFHKQYFLPI